LHKEIFSASVFLLVLGLIGVPIIGLLVSPTAPIVTILNVFLTLFNQAGAIGFNLQQITLAFFETLLFVLGTFGIVVSYPRMGNGRGK